MRFSAFCPSLTLWRQGAFTLQRADNNSYLAIIFIFPYLSKFKPFILSNDVMTDCMSNRLRTLETGFQIYGIDAALLKDSRRGKIFSLKTLTKQASEPRRCVGSKPQLKYCFTPQFCSFLGWSNFLKIPSHPWLSLLELLPWFFLVERQTNLKKKDLS